jgi:hypothetical protein
MKKMANKRVYIATSKRPNEMDAVMPEDRQVIEKLCSDVKKFTKLQMPQWICEIKGEVSG